MRIIIFKSLLLALLCCSGFNGIWAQGSEEPDPGASITPDPTTLNAFKVPIITPVLKSSTVVFYSDGLSAYVEFQTKEGAMVPQSTIIVDKNNANDTRLLTLSSGKSPLFTLLPGKIYNIKALANDGAQYIIGAINTNPYVVGEPINVSENLYRALSEYVTGTNQSVSLSTYLQQVPNVSLYESIGFVQKYVMNGATLPASIRGVFPTTYVQDAIRSRATEGECLCNFVMNQVTIVIPDQTGNSDFSIGPKTSQTGPNFYNKASFWSRGLTSMGAAKNQLLLNAGSAAGSKRRKESWVSGGETISDNFVRIGYHLMCIGMNELPRECDCEKTVKFDYGYSTRIEARTNAGGFPCILSSEAAARAQDWAIAVATREKVNSTSDVQVFGSAIGIATSTCKGGVPVSVIIDAAKIGVCVFSLIKSVKTAQLNDIINQTNDIITKVGAVLETITEPKDCDNALIEKPLLQGLATFTFKPNDPLSFMLMSGSSLEVSGLRCWSSKATVQSSFHLAGVVIGGAPTSSTGHCCTDYFANWAYASLNGDDSNRRNFINGHLNLNSPLGWQTINGAPNQHLSANISTQVGYAIGTSLPNGVRCTKTIPIWNNPH